MEIVNSPRVSQGSLDKPEAKAGALTSFNKGILRQNWAAAAVNDMVNGGEDVNHGNDLSYSWEADEENNGYQPSVISQATSSDHALEIRSRLDQEQRDLEIINSSGWGMAGELFGGVFRPETLVAPFAGGGRVLGMVAAEMTAEGMNESILHKQQLTRTQQESYLNIGLVGAGTAILGGAASMLSSKELNDYARDAGRSRQPVEDGSEINRQPKSASAQEAGGTFDDEGITGGVLAEKLSIGLMARSLQSPSKATRVIAQKLVDNPFFTKGGQKGQTHGVSVESKVYSHHGRTVSVIEKVKLLNRKSGLEADEFEDQVGIAMKNGGSHTNPEVVKAAKMYKDEVIDPVTQDMVDTGMLPKLKGDLKAELDDLVGQTEPAFISASKSLKSLTNKLKRLKADRKAGKEVDETDLEKVKKGVADSKQDLHDIVSMRSKLSKQVDEAVPFRSKKGKGYFPAIYRADLILEDYGQVKQILRDDLIAQGDIPLDEVNDFVIDRINRMMGQGTPNPTKRRSIEHLHDQLEPYMEKKSSAVMLAHVRRVSPHVQLKKTFGQSLDGVLDDVSQDFKLLIDQAPTESMRKKLRKKRAEASDDITRAWERVSNSVERQNPNSMSQKIIRRTKLFNITTQLGQITLSSLPDAVTPLTRYGMRSYAKGIARASRQFFNDLEGMSKAQIQRTGAATDRTLNQRIMTMTDGDEMGGRYEQWASRMFSKLTLFDQWTDAWETVAAHSSMDWTLRQGRKLSQGKRLTRSEKGQLSQMGLDHDRLVSMYKASLSSGGKDPILKFADTSKWDDINLAREFEAAIGSDVRRTIIRSGDGEKPNFMDDPLASLVFQYNTFAVSATNKLLVAGIQRRNLAVAQGLLASVFLGSMVGVIKTKLRGGDISDMTDQDFLYEGIDRSGIIGVYRPALSAIQAGTGHIPSRYMDRDITGILGGATIGQVDRGIRLGHSMVDGDVNDIAENAARLTPFVSNTLGVRQVLLLMGDN